jgi:hypothetical protein
LKLLSCFFTLAFLGRLAMAQGPALHPPADVVAGSAAVISTAGQGEATFYLTGPTFSARKQVRLGEDIQLQPNETRTAGRYLAILCAESCHSASFYVNPSDPAHLSFLLHPSRVAVGQSDAISAVVFPFDRYQNLVLAPNAIDFKFDLGAGESLTRSIPTEHGVAWFRTGSGKKAGVAHVSASLNELSVRRVVQLVASDPCNLRLTAKRTGSNLDIETEPVRDCSGNPAPDGTIVSFTETAAGTRSTADVPIKQGMARTRFPAAGPATISAASGVVMGSELHVGTQP